MPGPNGDATISDTPTGRIQAANFTLLDFLVDAVGLSFNFLSWVILLFAVGIPAAFVWQMIFTTKKLDSFGLAVMTLVALVMLVMIGMLGILFRWMSKGIFHRNRLAVGIASAFCGLWVAVFVLISLNINSDILPRMGSATLGVEGALFMIPLLTILFRGRRVNG